jgi:hypothetical protein
VEQSALDCAARDEGGFGVVDVGGRALGFTADVVGDGEADGGEGGGEPEDSEERGATPGCVARAPPNTAYVLNWNPGRLRFARAFSTGESACPTFFRYSSGLHESPPGRSETCSTAIEAKSLRHGAAGGYGIRFVSAFFHQVRTHVFVCVFGQFGSFLHFARFHELAAGAVFLTAETAEKTMEERNGVDAGVAGAARFEGTAGNGEGFHGAEEEGVDCAERP